ncbi:MAG: TonB-dependent receptor domain-containing protein, partial [Flavisolibacter sp.]
YGSYIAGAVNLYTPRSMPNQSGINEEVIGGSYGLFRNNTSISTSNGNSDLRLNYGHQTYTGFRPHNNSKKDYFNFATNFNLNEKNTISTYFSYNNSIEELAGEIDSADFYSRKVVSNNFYVLNNSHAAIESFRAGITDKYQFTDVLSNQTTMYTTGSTLNQAFAHGFTKNQNMNFGGRTSFMFEKNYGHTSIEGVIGGSFERTNQDTHGNFIPPFIMPPFTPSTSPNIPSASRNYALNYSLYSQWKISLPSQISITAGASVDFIEFGTQNLLHNGSIYLDNPINIKVFKPVLNPSVSLIKVFNSFVSMYANVSSGYTPATFSQMTNTNGQINTDLKPEKGIQYEIGTKGSIGKDKKLFYQVSLFDLDITNRLTQQSANGISFYTNAGEQQNKGAEVYIGYSAISNNNSLFRTVRPWISYTYSHFTYSDFKSHGKSSAGEDSIIADYSGNKVAGIPENIFNAGLDLMTKTGIYFNTTFRFNDKIPVTFTNTHFMKPYSLLSAKIGYRHQFGYHFSVDIYGGADNITNTTYYSMIFVGQNIQELAQAGDPNIPGGSGDGYILPAPYKASFYGGASLKFNF